MISSEDTIPAIATPLGESGLGLIRVSGSQAVGIVSKLFKPAKKILLTDADSHTCHLGTIGDLASPQPSPLGRGRSEATGEAEIDQVVITLFRAPHSYTGEDVVEISAHG